MQFTDAIVAAILAYTVSAAPTASSTMTTSTTSSVTAATAAATSVDPLLTQKLFLSDTAVDRFNLLPNDNDFVFNFDVAGTGPGNGGKLALANRKTFPALVSTGAAMAVGRVGPCGINTFHVHPRSVELQIVVEGKLVTEMTPENGVMDPNDPTKRRVIKTELSPYMMTPFYQGSVHTQFNPDCTDAVFVATFTSEDPGTGQIADELFSFDDDLIQATLGGSDTIDGKFIDKIRGAIPPSIARGVDECLAKCNIPKHKF